MSLRIVNEKQQLIKPSSVGGGPTAPTTAAGVSGSPLGLDPPLRMRADEEVGVGDDGEFKTGLKRRTHEVKTAFWLESNATWPYFWGGLVDS